MWQLLKKQQLFILGTVWFLVKIFYKDVCSTHIVMMKSQYI